MTIQILKFISIVIASMGVGAIWYGPLFGKQWMRLVGHTEKSIKAGVSKAMQMGLIATTIQVAATIGVVSFLAVNTPVELLQFELFAYVAFVVAQPLNIVIWSKGTWELFWINASHAFVTMLLHLIGAWWFLV